MKKIMTLLLTCALILTLAACGQKAPTWQEQYDLGVRYLSDGNYEEAIVAFTAVIEIDPKRVEAYVGRGDAYLGSGELDAAKADYEQAIGLDEDCAEAYLGLAEFYFAIGDTVHAEEAQNAARAALARRGVSAEGATLPQTVRTERQDLGDGRYAIYEYDSAGNVIKVTAYNADGTVEYWEICEYDSANTPLKLTIYNADGTVDCWGIYDEFDSAGNVIKVTIYNADGTLSYAQEHDSEGNIIKRTYYNADGTLSYAQEYDSEDNIIKQTYYNADGTVWDSYTP